MDIHGVGPAGAARILADVGDIARFADRNRFASWTGTAPLDASSGEQIRHRLSRAGNRRMNHVLHIAAIVQMRHDTEGRAYYRRKLAAGKTPMEALRCLKRRLSDVVYRQLVADAERTTAADDAGPGGHCGATLESSAVDLPPHIDTSDQPLPGPAQPTLRRPTEPERPTDTTAPTRPLTQRGARSGCLASGLGPAVLRSATVLGGLRGSHPESDGRQGRSRPCAISKATTPDNVSAGVVTPRSGGPASRFLIGGA